MTDITTKLNIKTSDPTKYAGKIVFIIEDDVFLGKVLEQKIDESKIVAKRFVNAEDALEALKDEIPHLILLDIFLPGLNGLDALEKMRGNEKTRDIPVIVVSNTDAAKDRETALGLGAQFLIKAATTPDEIVEHIYDNLAKLVD